MDEVLDFTIPQLIIFNKHLESFLKAEGGKDAGSSASNNSKSFGATVKMLKEKTGKDNFSLIEVLNPAETIKKHKVEKV